MNEQNSPNEEVSNEEISPEPTPPRRSSGRSGLLLPIGLATGAALAAVLIIRFGTDPVAAPPTEPVASLTLADPAQSRDSAAGGAPAAESADAERALDMTVVGTVSDTTDVSSDTATATKISPDVASPEATSDVALAVVEPDTENPTSSPSGAEPERAAAAPMIDIDAPNLQGLAELATLATSPSATDESDLPSVDDPVAGELFGSPVMLVSSTTPRVVVLADGTSLAPGAELPSGHRLVAIERERILLERDGREWRLKIP